MMIAQVFAFDFCRKVMPRFPFRVEMHLPNNLFPVVNNEISRQPNKFALSPILFFIKRLVELRRFRTKRLQKIIPGDIRTNVRFNP
jgi:hypothetical protein